MSKKLYYLYSSKFGYIGVAKKYDDAIKMAEKHSKTYSDKVTIKLNEEIIAEI